LTPFLPPRELHSRLAGTVSIGLVPLQDTYYNRYLTCPVKALDFISHGLPVIGTDLPSVRAVLGDAGCYADFSASPTANLIVDLLADAARYAAQSERTLARAQTLTWERRAAALVQFVAPMFSQRE
jgi:glycosyltransferase involved in cell wall biosynthesis